MSSTVINLSRWRSSVRVDGLTVIHRREKKQLTPGEALCLSAKLLDSLTWPLAYEIGGLTIMSLKWQSSHVSLSGFACGPVSLTRSKAAQLAKDLFESSQMTHKETR